MNEHQKQICRKVVDIWGHCAQRLMLIEECAELTVALCHQDRNKCKSIDVISEIADVYILLEQMKYIYGKERVNAAIEEKLNRLEKTLADLQNARRTCKI